jgi:UDP:flavonoid glycosyltransferase YjiC (YdhE family)
MKKKFLFTTLFSNDLGLLTRSLPIARELRDRGHQVVFYDPAKAPRKLISHAGFDNIPSKWPLLYLTGGDTSLTRYLRLLFSRHAIRDLGIMGAMLKHMKKFETPDIWNIDQFMNILMANETYIRVEVHDLIDVINEHRPDVVVDFWNVSACIAARVTRKRLITVIQADMHPQSKGFMWWREAPADVPSPTPVINKILAELRLKPVGKTAEFLVGDKTLVVGTPEMDPLLGTADVTYIGAVLWQKSDARLPDWAAELDATKPLIWIYSGNPQYIPRSHSVFDSSAVICACIEAFKDRDVQVVLSSGHQPLPKDVLPLPSNFRYVSFLPGLTMAERSDLLIHHGGYGSCQTGLFTGTPALIIPTFSERESNARRVAAAGAGDFVLPTTDASGSKRVDADEVREKASRILSDSSYKENARRISEKLRGYDGLRYAARLIEEST